MNKIELSIIVPVHNESGAIINLIEEINTALEGFNFEIIIVDDKSKDNTLDILEAAKADFPRLRVFAHEFNSGQSAAIYSGFRQARGEYIGTLDGDGQNDPADLPRLYRHLTRSDAPKNLGFIGGMRLKRQDSQAKKNASKIANSVRQALLKDGAIDSGCGIKILRRDIFAILPYFDHMHRYMAALVKQAGFDCEFIEVNHRPRETGASKYTNIDRLLAALTDLLGVIWLGTRRRKTGKISEI